PTLLSLTTDAPGSTRVRGNVTATVYQLYNDPVTLTASVAVTTAGTGVVITPVQFNSTVDGPGGLAVNTPALLMLFAGAVGGATPLASFSSSGAATLVNGGGVTTTGPQTYVGQTALTNAAAGTTLTSTAGGD